MRLMTDTYRLVVVSQRCGTRAGARPCGIKGFAPLCVCQEPEIVPTSTFTHSLEFSAVAVCSTGRRDGSRRRLGGLL